MMELKNDMIVSFLLRVGLATVFLYAAMSSFLNPTAWIGFFPGWIKSIAPVTVLLMLFSLYEIALSLWLLWGWKVKYSASLSALTLLAIIIINVQALDIVFRDVAIFFAALALIAMHWQEQ